MKPKAVEGYILAFGFLCTYKTENVPVGDLALIDKHLTLMMTKYKRNKYNFENIIKKGMSFFENYCVGQEMDVSVLSFILQLIVKNPNKDKNKVLTQLAQNLNKEHFFSKDEMIRNAKVLVNKYYGLGE